MLTEQLVLLFLFQIFYILSKQCVKSQEIWYNRLEGETERGKSSDPRLTIYILVNYK